MNGSVKAREGFQGPPSVRWKVKRTVCGSYEVTYTQRTSFYEAEFPGVLLP